MMKKNNKNKFIMSSRGASLVEIIIVAAIASIISLGMASMMVGASKDQGGVRFRMARTELRNNLLEYKSKDPLSCACSLNTIVFDPSTLPATIAIGGSGLRSFDTPASCTGPNITWAANGQTIENATITNLDVVISSGAGSNYSGSIRATLTASSAVSGPSNLNINIPMIFATIPSAGNRQISGCGTSAASNDVFDLDPAKIGDQMFTVPNGFSSWTMTNVPSTAKAVLLNYQIGRLNREDRTCAITNNAGQTYHVGHTSSGDGEPHVISGMIIVPIGGSNHLNFNCTNNGGQGNIKVIAVIN